MNEQKLWMELEGKHRIDREKLEKNYRMEREELKKLWEQMQWAEHFLKPLMEKLGERAEQFRIMSFPHEFDTLCIYRHHWIGYYLVIDPGGTWVFSRAAQRYVLSDWQTELNRFAVTFDREVPLCGGNCTCPWHDVKKQVATASLRRLWEPSIQTAREANAKPYSYEHWQAENSHCYQDDLNFCSDSAECDHSILRRSVLPEEEWPAREVNHVA